MSRLICLMVLVLVLAGCDKVQAGFTSRADKVNLAFPIADDLLAARDILFGALEGDPKLNATRNEFAKLLETRAAECSGSVELGRLDTPDKVKSKIGDAACFSAYDLKVADWVGMNRVVLELLKPPLIPFAPLSARVALSPETDSVSFAKDANVAMEWTRAGKMRAIELPSARVINGFQAPPLTSSAGTLSPNGRVLAISLVPNNLVMLDVASGNTLWSTSRYSGVLAWLPDIDATLLFQKKTDAITLFDHRSVDATPYPSPIKFPSWSIPMSEKPGRLLIGSQADFAVMDHVRRADAGIETVKAKQFQLDSQNEIRFWEFNWTTTPFLMSKGKRLVYPHIRDWAWMDIESGESGRWNVTALGMIGFAQVSDTAIYLDIGSGKPLKSSQLFDIERGTLTAVKNPAHESGVLYPATPRLGFVSRANGAVVVGEDAVAEGELQLIEKAAADIELWTEQMKIRNAAQQEQEQAARSALATTQVASSARIAVPGIPSNAHVSAIGVYESQNGGEALRSRSGPVDVKLIPSKVPLVLVLSSYEPVQWNVQANGRPIAAVLLSGSPQQKVQGYTGKVVVIGSKNAYQMGTTEYLALKALVAQYVPMPMRLFQGTYRGSEFSVPAN